MHLGEERHLDGTCSSCICRCRWREEIRRRWESRLRMWSAGVRAPEYHLNSGQPIRSQQIPTWSSLTNETLSNHLLRINTAQWALIQRHRQEMQVGEKLEGLRHYKSGSPTLCSASALEKLFVQEQRRCSHRSDLGMRTQLLWGLGPAVLECAISPTILPVRDPFSNAMRHGTSFFHIAIKSMRLNGIAKFWKRQLCQCGSVTHQNTWSGYLILYNCFFTT